MNSSSRNGAKVIWLCLHTTEGIMRATDLRAWTSWPGSSHAANDETGVLLSGAKDGFVDYSRASWTLRNGNPISDNLEQCGWARWTRADWLARPKLLDTTARWLAERHKARPWIPLRRLSHAEVRARVPGVIMHDDYSKATGDGSHWDCGPNYPWDVVLAKARAYVAGDTEQPAPSEEDTDMPLIINVKVEGGYVPHLLTGDRYFQLRDSETVRGLAAAGIKQATITQAAHADFVKNLSSEADPAPTPPAA